MQTVELFRRCCSGSGAAAAAAAGCTEPKPRAAAIPAVVYPVPGAVCLLFLLNRNRATVKS